MNIIYLNFKQIFYTNRQLDLKKTFENWPWSFSNISGDLSESLPINTHDSMWIFFNFQTPNNIFSLTINVVLNNNSQKLKYLLTTIKTSKYKDWFCYLVLEQFFQLFVNLTILISLVFVFVVSVLFQQSNFISVDSRYDPSNEFVLCNFSCKDVYE